MRLREIKRLPQGHICQVISYQVHIDYRIPLKGKCKNWSHRNRNFKKKLVYLFPITILRSLAYTLWFHSFFPPVIIFRGPTPLSLQGLLEFLNILLTVPFIGPLLQFYHSNSIKQIVYSLGLCSHLSWITPGGCSMPALPWGAQIRTLSGTQISGTALPSDGACVRATWDLWLCKHLRCLFYPVAFYSHSKWSFESSCASTPGHWVTSSERVNSSN